MILTGGLPCAATVFSCSIRTAKSADPESRGRKCRRRRKAERASNKPQIPMISLFDCFNFFSRCRCREFHAQNRRGRRHRARHFRATFDEYSRTGRTQTDGRLNLVRADASQEKTRMSGRTVRADITMYLLRLLLLLTPTVVRVMVLY